MGHTTPTSRLMLMGIQIALSMPVVSSAATRENLLLNPGAEQGKNGQPSVWVAAQIPAEGLRMWQDLDQRHGGSASLAIANAHDYPQPVSNNWAQAIQVIPAGKVVQLSAFIKTVDADAANVCVQCWDLEGGRMLGFASTPVFRGDQDWILARAQPLVVPADTKSMTVRAALTGKGKAWFDDLTLSVADASQRGKRLDKQERGTSAAAIVAQQGRGAEGSVPEELVRRAPGRIVRALPVIRDCMVLKYMPQWAHGSVDNIAVANNDGGVRTLVGYPPIPSEEWNREDRRFLVALYSRKTTATPPVGLVQAYEILSDWAELTPWDRQPKHASEPAATFDFVPGEGWKLFDITPLVRAQCRAKREDHGVMLRFAGEDRSMKKRDWSGYAFVSREGAGEWSSRQPLLLVIEPGTLVTSKPAAATEGRQSQRP